MSTEKTGVVAALRIAMAAVFDVVYPDLVALAESRKQAERNEVGAGQGVMSCEPQPA